MAKGDDKSTTNKTGAEGQSTEGKPAEAPGAPKEETPKGPGSILAGTGLPAAVTSAVAAVVGSEASAGDVARAIGTATRSKEVDQLAALADGVAGAKDGQVVGAVADLAGMKGPKAQALGALTDAALAGSATGAAAPVAALAGMKPQEVQAVGALANAAAAKSVPGAVAPVAVLAGMDPAKAALAGGIVGGLAAGSVSQTVSSAAQMAGVPAPIAKVAGALAKKALEKIAPKTAAKGKAAGKGGGSGKAKRSGDEPRFFFVTEAYPTQLEVLSFSGVEGLSELHGFQIELTSRDKEIDFDKLVGKSALLYIIGDAKNRNVHGITTRFELIGVTEHRAIYRAHLAAPHIRMTLRRNLRIFQDLTTQQIVTKVMNEGGIQKLKWTLKASYQPRNYCVQYRETDMEFISRLLEEEGITFHFEHLDAELVTVFTDANSAFQPIAGEQKVMFNAITSMVSNEEYVNSFVFGQQVRMGNVHLRDYSFKQPTTPVDAKATGKEPQLELYEYPGEFVDQGLGGRLATVRLQELEAERLVGAGASDCVRLVPGFKFTLGKALPGEQHPRKDFNQEYLLTRVTHSGHQPQALGEEADQGPVTYSNHFFVVPGKVEWRPARVTPRPVALGTHTAVVVGPKGEEIYVDKFGRVKVSFHWDRESKLDENSSCWIRVAQNWAGAGYGGMFIPRIGQEVVINFLEGDPDRPYVTGRVYNAVQAKHYELPTNKTVTSIKSASSPGGAGYNEIRFEDNAGKEEIFVHAQKDMNVVVGNDRTTMVGHDRKELVNNNQTVSVTHLATHTAEEILVEASKKMTIKVGSSSIVLEPASIKVFSSTINTKSSGLTEIKGALVKIN
jgi:type VI secretion system secreted protein VgrG